MMFDGAAVATAVVALSSEQGADQQYAAHADMARHAVPEPAADHHADGDSAHGRFALDHWQLTSAPLDAATAGQGNGPTSVIFIDTSVKDYASLVDEWSGKGDIVLIDATRDGIDQVMTALAGRSNLESIHFVSHGDVDRFSLGTTLVTTASVNAELAASLAAIGAKLSATGDILIYGCDVSSDDAGQTFLNALAAKTGADVAASNDPTGAVARGGDWDLEARVGQIDSFVLTSDRYNEVFQLSNNAAAWTIAGNTATNVTDGVTSTIVFSGTTLGGTPLFTNTGVQTLNTIDAFANAAAGAPSVTSQFNGGAALAAVGTIMITFSEAVVNPIIHLDRLGGNAGAATNTAVFALTTNGATLTRLTGPAHFLADAGSGTIQRLAAPASASTESSLDGTQGSAAGSVRINGTYTTITFSVQMSLIGGLGIGDAFEIGTTIDAAPVARADAFAINRGQTLNGNLYANNGGGADSDVRGDALTVTRVNGATFTVGQPIALDTGTLTIINASTGAFTFVPRAGYPTTQAFTYTIADANGGTSTATATIVVNDVPTIALSSTNLVVNGSFENDTGWTAESGGVEYSNIPSNYGSPVAPDGTRFAEVEGSGTSRYIEQTIATVVGQQYSFSLQATTRSLDNVGDKGSLFVNGVKVLDFTTSAQYQTFMTTFAATSTSTVIRIQSEGSVSGGQAAPNDTSGLVVDDVQIRAINTTIGYVENGAATPIAAVGDRIFDFDSANLASALVTLTNQQTGDRLLINGSAAASGTIGSIGYTRTDTGVAFTGSATKAQYEAAIRAVQFENTTDNPGITPRTITVTASDGTATSNTATVTVNVTPVNDAPVNTLPATYTMAEDSGALALTGLSVADIDAGTGTITVTLSVPTGQGTLAALAAGGVSITGSGTNTLLLSGTLANINAYLTSGNRPTYAQVADFNGNVTLTMTVNDGGNTGTGGALTDVDTAVITITAVADIAGDAVTGNEDTTIAINPLTNDSFENSGATITAINGTGVIVGGSVAVANGSVSLNAGNQLVFTPVANFNGSSTFSYTVTAGGVTETANVVVTVNPVNDAPSGTNATLNAAEDTPRVLAVADFGFSDVTEGNAFAGVIVTTLPANGTLLLNGTTIAAGTFVTAAQINAGQLTFTAATNANGNGLGAFTFQVRDNGGTANGGQDTDQSPNSINFTVTAVNDAPAGTNAVLNATEDTSFTLAAASFGFADPIDGDGFAGVVITTLPANGTLTLNGAAVTAGQFVSAAQLGANQLVWTPAANANGNNLGAFTFQVRDTGGTANGGQDTDQSPNTLGFNVASVNDAPAGTNATLVAVEDTPYVFAAANFGFGDTDGNAFGGVVITTLPASGALLLNGTAVTAGQFVTAAQIAVGQLTWQGATNANGTGLGSFTFQVRDDGGTAAGGIDTDQSPNAINFTVTAVNDAPAGTNVTLTALEDTPLTITGANFGFSDVDGNSFAGVVIATLPANGILRLNGTAVTAGQFVTAAQITANQLTWQGAANANGPGLGSFTFQVRDDGGTAAGGVDTDQSPNTMNFTVTAVNDAPAGNDATLTATEDTPYVFAAANFGFSDGIDGNAFAGVVITTIPANGTMLLNGTAVTAGQFVTAAQLSANQLTWQGAANANGPGLGSFTFQVRDNAGTANGGIDTDQSPNTITFTVAPVNDAPTLDLNGAGAGTGYAASYTENGAGVAISSGPTVADIDSATMGSASFVITNGAIGDVLSIAGALPAGITANYDATTYTLTLSGSASSASYATAVGQVRYSSTSDSPSTVTRTINGVVVDNAGLASNVATAAISVTAVNDPIANTTRDYGVAEDGALTLVGLSVSDLDAGTGTITVTLSVPSGQGSLTAASSGGVIVTGSGSNAITLDGTLANINAYLANGATQPVFRQSVADFNGTVTLTMTSSDNGNAGGGATTDTDVATITITPVADIADDTISVNEDGSVTIAPLANDSFENGAPQISAINGTAIVQGGSVAVAAGSVTLNAGNQLVFTPAANFSGPATFSYTVTAGGTTETANVAVTVNAVNDRPTLIVPATVAATEDTAVALTGISFGDVDAGSGAARITLAVTSGILNWAAFGGVVASGSGSGTLVLTGSIGAINGAIAASNLTFAPAANANGAVTLTTTVNDQGNSGIDPGTSGDGSSEEASATTTINVAPVNDAPVAANDSFVTTENTPVTFTVLTNDGDVDSPTLTITRIDGNAIASGGSVAVTGGSVRLNGDNTLTFTPTAGFSGAPGFTYTISDGSLTATGTVFGQVGAINHAPAGTDATLSLLEDGTYAFAAADFGYGDTLDGNAFTGVVVTSLPANGVLRLNGGAVTAGQFVTAAQLAAGQLTFAPAANANGTGLGAFTFQVRDDGGTANGGIDTDQSPNTIRFTVTPVNDAPSGTDTSLSATEDTPYVLAATSFGFSDPDGDAFAGVVIATLPANGSLTLNGVALTAGQFVAAGDIAAGALIWTPAANANGAGLGAFAFQVRDTGGTTNGGVNTDGSPKTLSFNVAAVNDTPVAANDGFTVAEDTAFAIDVRANDTDPDVGAVLTVTAVNGNAITVGGVGIAVTGGVVTLDAQGRLVFTPTANVNGPTSFTYTVRDENGATATASVNGTITPVADPVTNTAPAAVTAAEDTAIVFGAATGRPVAVSDPDNGTLTITLGATRGVLTLSTLAGLTFASGDGTSDAAMTFTGSAAAINAALDGLRFVPNADYYGAAQISLSSTRGQDNANDTDVIAITLTPVADAVGDAVTTAEDTAVVFNVLTGAGGASPDNFEDTGRTLIAVTQPPAGQGSVTFAADGTITYIPSPDFNGATSFTYTVSAGGVSETATVTLTVSAVNDAPILDLDGGAAGTGYATSYTENGAGVAIIAANGGVADVDSATLASATMVIANGSAGDVLSIAGGLPAGITASYDATSYTLTLSGAATPAQYKAALAAVRYASTSDNPGTVARTINISVNDGALASATATATVAIVPVSDAPQGADAVLNAVEDTPYVFAAGDFGFTDPGEGDAFAGVVITTLPASGTLRLNGAAIAAGNFVSAADIAAGNLRWTPAPDARGAGLGSFTFRVRDTGSAANGGVITDQSPNSISFTVANVNDAPVSADLAVTIAEDGSAGGALPGFTDADGDGATYRAGTTMPAHGSVTINTSGTYSYIPAPNFNGTDVFSFIIDDGNGGTVEQYVTVTVTAVNDAPILVSPIPDRAGIDGASISFDGSAYFADPADGDTLTYTVTGLPAGLSMNAAGLITGTIARNASQGGPGANGVYTVIVTAADGNGGTVSDTFVYAITNPAPIAVNDAVTTAEDTAVTVNVLDGSAGGADSDPDGDPLTVLSAGAGHGIVTIGANGVLTYTPNANFNGTDSIVYTISDGNGGTAQAVVNVTVTAVNDAPTAVQIPDGARNDGETISFDAGASFSDIDRDALSFTATGLPPGLTINAATGLISGRIASDASGPTGSRTYSITITANDGRGGTVSNTFAYIIANLAPTASDDAASVAEDGTVDIDALGNDRDPDGDLLLIVRVNNQTLTVGGPAVATANGQVSLVDLGAKRVLRFTANADYNGTDSFTYTVDDGNGGVDTAVVSVNVIAVNDGPVSPKPIPDQVRADGQTFAYNIGAFFTDPDADAINYTVTGLPAGLTIDPATGLISGTIDRAASQGGPGANGVYTVTVTAFDRPNATGFSTARTFQLTATNPGPTASNDAVTTSEDTPVTFNVLDGSAGGADTDPDGDVSTVIAASAGNGTVTIGANGALTYAPNANFNGRDTIVYTISDGNGGVSSASVVVIVDAVNDAPVAGSIPTIMTSDDAVIDFDVGGYFSDGDAAQDLDFTYIGTLPPGLSFDAETGRITGQLAGNASMGTPYTMTITADDGMGGTVSTTLTWNIQNLPPHAVSDTLFVAESAGVTAGVNVLDNDVDPDNDGKIVAAINGVAGNVGLPVIGSAGGTFVVNADGTYTFDPGTAFDDLQVGQTRTTTITYLLDDTDGGTDTGFVTVTVDGRNDAPVAQTIPQFTAADQQSLTTNPLALASYFADAERDTLTFSATGLPPGLTMGADGRIIGTIAMDASRGGPYTVTVTANDGRTTTAQSFVFNVTNPAPTANNDTATTTEDTALDVAVIGNDTDPDGDAPFVDPTFPPVAAHGSVTINADGTLRYVPDADFNGSDTIVYRISDGDGGLSTASVTVTVLPANDAPTGSPIPDSARDDGDGVSLNVSGYFRDIDRDTLTYTVTGLPAGLVLDPATGVISGTIAAGASGPGGRTDYAVQVNASDGNGGIATVRFTLTAVNIAPVAATDAATTLEDQAVVINVLGNDSDPDGDGVAVIRVDNVALSVGQSVTTADGVVTLINDAGTLKLSFAPNPNFNGIASFSYTIGDGNNGFDDAGVRVTVVAVNDAPVVASPIPARSRPDGAIVNFGVAGFFDDVDGDTLSYIVNGLPPGLTYDSASGVISGVIARNASQGGVGGVYAVTVIARDASGTTATQTFDFTATNPPPQVGNDSVNVAEDGSVTFNPITGAGTVGGAAGADIDPDNDPLSVVSVSGQSIAPGTSVSLAQGVLSMNVDGSLTFVPAADFNGVVTIPYTISDGNGGTAQAVITLTVTAVNDAPAFDLNGAAPGVNRTIVFTEGDVPQPIAAVDASAFDVEDEIVRLDVTLAGFADTGREIVHLNGRVDFVVGAPVSGTILFGSTSFRYSYDGAAVVRIENAAAPGTPLGRDDVTALIRAFQYDNVSDNPTAGNRALTFTVTDAQGAMASATATVQVAPVNDAPTSSAIAAQAGSEAAVVTFDVSGFFADADSALTFSATGLPPGLAIDPTTGVISGTIDRSASLTGPYDVIVSASDGVATTSQGFRWAVANPAPVAVNDTLTVGENAVGSGDVTPGTLGQDSDPDGDPLTVSAVDGSAANVGAAVAGTNGGRFTVSADGSYSFDPGMAFDDLGFGQTRTTAATYTVSDGQGGSGTATITVTVTGANDAPTATALPTRAATDGATVRIATATSFADRDAGDALIYNATGLPIGLTIDRVTGEILGTLTAGASRGAPYTITVTATDGSGLTATSSFVLNVSNVLPVARADSAITAEDRALLGSVATNDSDGASDGDSLTYALIGAPAHGTLVLQSDGRYTYTPEADFSGTDSFTYQVDDGNGGTATAVVTLTITSVNDAPVVGNGRFTTLEDTPVTFDVRANARDIDSVALNVVAIDGAAIVAGQTVAVVGGRVTLNADGTLTYTPNPDFNGAPTFTYTVSDGQLGGTGTVSGSVVPVNDAPSANPVAIVAAEDVPVMGQIGSTDVDGDTLSYILATLPAFGVLTLNPDGSYRYVPAANFNGSDSFTVLVSDGNGSSVVATIPITVTPVNDAPAATASPIVVAEDGAAVGRVAASDVEGDAIGYALTTAPARGALTLNADGSYRYAPNADFNGTDSFTITVRDSQGGTTLLTVPVTVTAVNDPPVVLASPLTATGTGAALGRIVASDVDGDRLTFALDSAPAHGVIVINADGSFSYTPTRGYIGSDSFAVRASDGNGGSAVVTVPVTVAAGNTAPTDRGETIVAPQDQPVVIPVLANASDADGDRLSVISASASAGTVVINADGTITYLPPAGFTGNATITYIVSDGQGGTAASQVAVAVAPAGVDIGALLSLGGLSPVAGLSGPTADAALAISRFDARPIVLDAVSGIRSLNGTTTLDGEEVVRQAVDRIRGLNDTPDLGGDQPLLRAINGLQSLAGTPLLSGPLRQADGMVRYLDRVALLGSRADLLFDARPDAFAVRSFEGFSVRSMTGGERQLGLDSVVHGHVLYIELRDEGSSDQPPIVEFQLRTRDGRPLPEWIRVDARGLAIVERPLDADELRLIAVGIRADGSRIELPIIVQGATGEIERDAPVSAATDERIGAGSLKALVAQAHVNDAAKASRLLAAFSGRS